MARWDDTLPPLVSIMKKCRSIVWIRESHIDDCKTWHNSWTSSIHVFLNKVGWLFLLFVICMFQPCNLRLEEMDWDGSGQIIATSYDLTPNGGSVREIPLFQGNLGWWNIIIWPEKMDWDGWHDSKWNDSSHHAGIDQWNDSGVSRNAMNPRWNEIQPTPLTLWSQISLDWCPYWIYPTNKSKK